jgi:acyl-CoA synthetase (AMP-forming)/AMP-acid ligase II
MQGYWRNSQASEQVIQNGWLKTGDLAYRDEDGFLFIQGRNSEMIKSGANRISPQEIEEVITQLEAVAEVAAVGVPDDILGEAIKAVVVVRNGCILQKRDIQSHCRGNLAIYKIPKYVEFVDELPKTASGKVKRHMLVH